MPSFADPRLAPKLKKEPEYVAEMLKEGKDPKDKLIQDCSPMCIFWKEKLQRCEKKLEKIIKVNPTKSCLYPMRDWVTCVDACVNPTIFHHLKK